MRCSHICLAIWTSCCDRIFPEHSHQSPVHSWSPPGFLRIVTRRARLLGIVARRPLAGVVFLAVIIRWRRSYSLLNSLMILCN